jgi:CRISPR-associated protein Cmr6
MMSGLGARQSATAGMLPECGILRLDAHATAPFTTGLGNEHPLENGFAFLNPYGLPYLPGSGVKGVLRQAARELASGEWGEMHGWSNEQRYPLILSGKVVLDSKDQPVELSMLDVLFGPETPDGGAGHVRGVLSFWDVVPQIEGDSLMVEIMTPHQTHYYQDGQSPHDSGQPNPISFLTVPPGSRFVFHVICDLARLRRVTAARIPEGSELLAEGPTHWKTLLQSAFNHAFAWLGFGAKTAVGYGAMSEGPVAPSGSRIAAKGAATVNRGRDRPVAASAETRWENAQLKFNGRNGTLTATGPRRAEAHAHKPAGEGLLAALPPLVQQRLRQGQPVRAVAYVRGHDLIRVEATQ